MSQARVTFILATHNRRKVVLDTLDRIAECGLKRGEYDIVVVDNSSTDGTPEAIEGFDVHLIRLDHNAGSCGKAFALDRPTAEFVVFLDDDSHPQPGSIGRMFEKFEHDPKLGAAGFAVHLPSGGRESGALPGVFVGCGVGFRAEALGQVSGLDRDLFMQAEEYDLSFKLAAASWKVEVFNDLRVNHLKTATARKNDRTTYHDIRNNLLVAARYIPSPYHRIYYGEYMQRYGWLAKRDGHLTAFQRGATEGASRSLIERSKYRDRRLSPEVFERFFRIEQVEGHMKTLAADGVGRIVLAGLGKNVFAFRRAARRAGIQVQAIADDRFAAIDRLYRLASVITVEQALELATDAFVVADMSAVHARNTRLGLSNRTARPIHDWFGLRDKPDASQVPFTSLTGSADKHHMAAPA